MCKPILKRNSDYDCSCDIASEFFRLGTKQSDCALCWCCIKLIDILAEIFELNSSLTAFENFVSTNECRPIIFHTTKKYTEK